MQRQPLSQFAGLRRRVLAIARAETGHGDDCVGIDNAEIAFCLHRRMTANDVVVLY